MCIYIYIYIYTHTYRTVFGLPGRPSAPLPRSCPTPSTQVTVLNLIVIIIIMIISVVIIMVVVVVGVGVVVVVVVVVAVVVVVVVKVVSVAAVVVVVVVLLLLLLLSLLFIGSIRSCPTPCTSSPCSSAGRAGSYRSKAPPGFRANRGQPVSVLVIVCLRDTSWLCLTPTPQGSLRREDALTLCDKSVGIRQVSRECISGVLLRKGHLWSLTCVPSTRLQEDGCLKTCILPHAHVYCIVCVCVPVLSIMHMTMCVVLRASLEM